MRVCITISLLIRLLKVRRFPCVAVSTASNVAENVSLPSQNELIRPVIYPEVALRDHRRAVS